MAPTPPAPPSPPEARTKQQKHMGSSNGKNEDGGFYGEIPPMR